MEDQTFILPFIRKIIHSFALNFAKILCILLLLMAKLYKSMQTA